MALTWNILQVDFTVGGCVEKLVAEWQTVQTQSDLSMVQVPALKDRYESLILKFTNIYNARITQHSMSWHEFLLQSLTTD